VRGLRVKLPLAYSAVLYFCTRKNTKKNTTQSAQRPIEQYQYWQAKNMILILKLINDEFRIKKKFKAKYIWPNDDWK